MSEEMDVMTRVINPEPPTDIWDVWWKVPVDPEDTNMVDTETRCPKVVLNPDGKTLAMHNTPNSVLTSTFAANLAATLISAALWIHEHP